jgi:hypothetical protein
VQKQQVDNLIAAHDDDKATASAILTNNQINPIYVSQRFHHSM